MSGAGAIFDAPGPRTRMIIHAVTVVSLIAISALIGWGFFLFAANGQLAWEKWVGFTQWPTIRYLFTALANTLLATLGAAAIALPLGLVLALGRIQRNPWVRWPAAVIIELFRAIPLLLIIYIFLIALPRYGVNPDLFWKLVIPIALCAAATIAEVLRAGLLAVPAGQAEAGRAIGLTETQIFRSILIPQAVRMVIPSLVSQLVILLKDTTLGYVVSFGELQHSARVLIASTGDLIQTYLVVTLIYVALNIAISRVAHLLDQRLARSRRARVEVDAVGTTL